jgi:hypothetical protein
MCSAVWSVRTAMLGPGRPYLQRRLAVLLPAISARLQSTCMQQGSLTTSKCPCVAVVFDESTVCHQQRLQQLPHDVCVHDAWMGHASSMAIMHA